MSPFRAGLIAVVVIAVGTYFAFSKEVPFRSHYEVSAVFHSANNVKERQPVRIAGVDVGKVVEIEHPEPGKARAVIRMRIEDEGRPVHADATVKIRPRLFLEGNWLIDLEPGTAAAKEIPDGGTIPIQQTSTPVQLGPGAHRAPVEHAQEPPDAVRRVLERARGRGRRRLPPLDPPLEGRLPGLRAGAGGHARPRRARPVRLHRRRRARGPRARPQPGAAEEPGDRLQHRGGRLRARGRQPRAGDRRAAAHAARRAARARRAEPQLPAAAPLRARPAAERARVGRDDRREPAVPAPGPAPRVPRRAARARARPAPDRAARSRA